MVVVLLLLLVTVVQAMTKTVLGAQLRSRQRLRCGEGGAFPGGPAPAWARFPFLATSAVKMGMLLPFMAIFALNLGCFTLRRQLCSKPGAAFASSSRFPPSYECLVPFRARLVPNMRILSPFNSFVFAKSGDAFPFRTIFALSLGTVCP